MSKQSLITILFALPLVGHLLLAPCARGEFVAYVFKLKDGKLVVGGDYLQRYYSEAQRVFSYLVRGNTADLQAHPYKWRELEQAILKAYAQSLETAPERRLPVNFDGPYRAASAAPMGRIVERFQPYLRAIESAARSYQVDRELIIAVIWHESGFDPKAVSIKGAMGLMQLIPETARRFAVQDPFDPVQSINGGARYLRYLLDLYRGEVELALAAYNAGEGAVANRVPVNGETEIYVQRVSQTWRMLEQPLGGEEAVEK